MVRRHRLQQRRLAVEHADAGGAIQLVAREGVEIAVERAHIDLEVGRRLGAVDEHRSALGVGKIDDALHRIDGSQRVRQMRHRDEPGARTEQALQLARHQLAVVVDRRDPQHRAAALAQQLPRHDVGVVLHLGDEDLVARLQTLPPTRRHEVDGLRRAAHEHDFLAPCRVDEAPHGIARGLVGVGRLLAQGMHTAVNVGIELGVVARLAIDHALRLLAGGGVVEVDEGLAVHAAVQDREILAQPRHVEGQDWRRAAQCAQFARCALHSSSFTCSLIC